MVGDHVACDDRSLRMAALAPDLDQPALRLKHRSGAGYRTCLEIRGFEIQRIRVLTRERLGRQTEHA